MRNQYLGIEIQQQMTQFLQKTATAYMYLRNMYFLRNIFLYVSYFKQHLRDFQIIWK